MQIMKSPLLLSFCLLATNFLSAQTDALKISIIGLSHTHVQWVFDSRKRGDIDVIGIVEPDRQLAERFAKQYDYPLELIYRDTESMISASDLPEAVAAFGTIYDHLDVVETFAPLGVDVMVEKPLAVSVKHARKMAALAKEHNIHLITNYETSWYPTNHKAYELVKQEKRVGDIRKVVVRDGHRGPKKIGVNEEFLDWLTDPVLNGGGAVTDFGCYGANLITWLMEGRRPKTVTAITTQFQPENNPKVDDEAIILLEYDEAVGVIQASWNWPMGRKDMEIYGLTGAVYADNRNDLRLRIAEGYDGFSEEQFELPERATPYHDPFVYLTAVVRSEIEVKPTDLGALENNLLVVEILEAAIKSAKRGKSVKIR